MAAGRPIKYTKKSLGEAIRRYFRSISRTTEAKDSCGHSIKNDDGDVITVTQYVVPPSVSAMCLFLGIDRSTWQNYSDPELHPEMKDITTEARARIEAYLEEQLLTRDKGLQGIIFNLQNNYGWKQKQEVDLGSETRRVVVRESLSFKEKIALISSAQALISDAGENDGTTEIE